MPAEARVLPGIGGGGRSAFFPPALGEVGIDPGSLDAEIGKAMIIERHQLLIGSLSAAPVGKGRGGGSEKICEKHGPVPVYRLFCDAQYLVLRRSIRKIVTRIQPWRGRDPRRRRRSLR